MEIQELKNVIALIECAERNIQRFQSLKNRELAIIPTDSHYFKMFERWKEESLVHYDGEKEKSPSYVSGKKANELIDLLIKHQEEFINPHKQMLDKALSKV